MSKILITGSSMRIGAALARACAQDLMTVVLHYNQNEASAQSLAQELRLGGATIEIVGADLSDEEAVNS